MRTLLEQIDSIKAEKQDLENRIKSLEKERIPTTVDSVQASSKEYPYIQHTVKIEGYNNYRYIRNRKARNTYKKQIESKIQKLDKLINELEYELNKIEDSEIKQIIRYKYEDSLSYIQIAHRMNQLSKKGYTEDGIRMKIKRFLKNF